MGSMDRGPFLHFAAKNASFVIVFAFVYVGSGGGSALAPRVPWARGVFCALPPASFSL